MGIFDSKLNCPSHSNICNYRCCSQSLPQDLDFCAQNSILLYPGELASAIGRHLYIGHLTITDQSYFGGNLAYCSSTNFDQSNCDPFMNFKPLDCISYPFFPSFIGNELVLMFDSARCPLKGTMLHLHYIKILRRWYELTSCNIEIINWIKSVELEGYRLITVDDMRMR